MPGDRSTEQGLQQLSPPGECRRCRSFCDKMIEPRDCAAIGCPYLYSHIDEFNGHQYVGCMRQVFKAEVDLEALRGPGGFGGVKVTGQLLPHCQFRVEQAYHGTGSEYDCVNPRFFDCADAGPEGLRAFDLRDVLEADGDSSATGSA